MASLMGMRTRVATAKERTDAAFPRLEKALGFPLPAIPEHRDRVLLEALRAEWVADLLETIADQAEAQPTPISRKRTPKSAA